MTGRAAALIDAADWPEHAQVGFHDAECHGYVADLPVWRELAAAVDGPVLDVGAGTGRVALDLASRGHDVTALDRDPVLLRALHSRAVDARLRIRTVVADAEALPVAQLRGERRGRVAEPAPGRDGAPGFALVLVPMQTVQLLTDRPALLNGIGRLLAPGATVALAIADTLVGFDAADGNGVPEPDRWDAGGWNYESQPVAVRIGADRARIERVRTAIGPDGARTVAEDVISLRRLDAPTLHAEAEAAGLRPRPGVRIDPTEDHVGSEVVVLGG